MTWFAWHAGSEDAFLPGSPVRLIGAKKARDELRFLEANPPERPLPTGACSLLLTTIDERPNARIEFGATGLSRLRGGAVDAPLDTPVRPGHGRVLPYDADVRETTGGVYGPTPCEVGRTPPETTTVRFLPCLDLQVRAS
jgi:hypothetical protein